MRLDNTVTTSFSPVSSVAKRYAGSLLEMAQDKKSVEKIEKDMETLKAMLLGSQDLSHTMVNPLVSKDQKKAVLLELAKKAKMQKLTANFLGVVSDSGRADSLQEIVRAFEVLLRESRGQVDASIQSAVALTPAQTKKLQEELSKSMGSTVALNVSVDKDLLGGMIVTVGSQMIDDSVRRKLERLQMRMSAGK